MVNLNDPESFAEAVDLAVHEFLRNRLSIDTKTSSEYMDDHYVDAVTIQLRLDGVVISEVGL